MEQESNTKKSLMNSYERLSQKAEMFEELQTLTEDLICKLERTEDLPRNKGLREPTSDRLDLIDMFNSVDDRLEELANQITRNIRRVIDMIE